MASILNVDQINNAAGTSAVTIDSSGNVLMPGHVIQVLQALKTDTFSTTSGTFVQVPDLTVTITPSSTSSKILITGNIAIASSVYAWHCGLFQNGTEIGLADAAANRVRSLFNGSADFTVQNSHGQINYLTRDLLVSPNTTSALTFDIRAKRRNDNQGNAVCYINRSVPDRDINGTYDPRLTSTLTVMEIAQ